MHADLAYLAYDFARFYDWTHEKLVEDIGFYLNLANKCGSPLLELACGTGRITIPLARKGHRVTGLDISQEMLKIAEAKLSKEPPAVRERVRLRQGDMSDFDLPEPTNMAFIPAASFFHLHTKEEQVGCVSCVHKHLAADGLAIIDLIPAAMMANQAIGNTEVVKSGVAPASGKMTRELNQKLSIDRESQRVTVEHTYGEEESDGSEKRYVFVQDYTWVTQEEMQTLLQNAGFKQISVFGDYDCRPFDDESRRMIFAAHK